MNRFSLLLLLLVSNTTIAQVVMQQPFIPLAPQADYPIVSPTGDSLQKGIYYYGLDENSQYIYGNETPTITAQEFAYMLQDSLGSVSSADTVLNQHGISRNPSSGVLFVHKSSEPLSAASGQCLLMLNVELSDSELLDTTLGNCMSLVWAIHGPQTVYHQLCQTANPKSMHFGGDGAPFTAVGFFTADNPIVQCFPPEPEDEPLTDHAQDAMKLLLDDSDTVGKLDQQTVNEVIQDKIDDDPQEWPDAWPTYGSILTVNYEQNGDLGDVNGGTTENPTGQTPGGDGEGEGDGVSEYCAENPDSLLCVDINDSPGQLQVTEQVGTETVTIAGADGADICPAPPEAAGIVFDNGPLCDGLIAAKPFTLLVASLVSALIFVRAVRE